MILVWTCRGDTTVDWFIANHLSSSGVPWIRFDTDTFPEKYSIEGGIDTAKISARGRACVVDPRAVTSVWFRREMPSTFEEEKVSAEALSYIQREAQASLVSFRGLMRSARWLNRPEFNQAASDKAAQLRHAQHKGFRIPKTLITNNHEAAIDLANKCGGSIIAKPLRAGTIADGRVFYSNLLSIAEIQSHAKSIAVSPLIFQECIWKKFEVRAVVVGNECFGVKILSQEQTITSIDWRRKPLALKHEVLDLPPIIAERCVAMTRESGLWFSAFDLIVTQEEEYVFLEHNPMGQFAWLEELTGIPIGRKILDILSPNSINNTLYSKWLAN